MILVNDHPIEFTQFPNGETVVDKKTIKSYARGGYSVVTLKYETDADLLHLLFVRECLTAHRLTLRIRYMPYSRMDRPVDPYLFTLRDVCRFINAMKFRNVIVEEPHSDVTLALLDNSQAVYPTIDLLDEVENQIGFNRSYDYLFFPDAGAHKRYGGLLDHNVAVGYKHRDPKTGELTGEMEMIGLKAAMGRKVLILDDLCSKGGTFIMAAKELDVIAREVHLFVAHCENSMWKGNLLDHIDGLWTTDSILTRTPNFSIQKPYDASKVHIYTNGVWK